MHQIVLWKWLQPGFRQTYTHEHVNHLAASIKQHMNGHKHRIVCVTDDPGGIDMSVDVHPLWKDYDGLVNNSGPKFPSCYRRLKLFDPATQKAMGIAKDDRIVSWDLDSIVASDLTPVVTRKERFVGWAVKGTRHLRVFNGSMFMFNPGDFEDIWTKFDPLTSPKAALAAGFFGSDQAWLSYRLARRTDCAGWSYPQVVSYPREAQRRPSLPNGCSVVFFHGRYKPWHEETQRMSPWVKQHWSVPDAVQAKQ